MYRYQIEYVTIDRFALCERLKQKTFVVEDVLLIDIIIIITADFINETLKEIQSHEVCVSRLLCFPCMMKFTHKASFIHADYTSSS